MNFVFTTVCLFQLCTDNGDGGHMRMMQPVCAMIKNTEFKCKMSVYDLVSISLFQAPNL